MAYSREQILEIMDDPRYPLSNKYDPDWIIQNWMGSHCLWLQEALARDMRLSPGQRVLDLGCGKALSSVFLAREYGTQVWAADLWNSASDNWGRIREMGVGDKVFPIRRRGYRAGGYFPGWGGKRDIQEVGGYRGRTGYPVPQVDDR